MHILKFDNVKFTILMFNLLTRVMKRLVFFSEVTKVKTKHNTLMIEFAKPDSNVGQKSLCRI